MSVLCFGTSRDVYTVSWPSEGSWQALPIEPNSVCTAWWGRGITERTRGFKMFKVYVAETEMKPLKRCTCAALLQASLNPEKTMKNVNEWIPEHRTKCWVTVWSQQIFIKSVWYCIYKLKIWNYPCGCSFEARWWPGSDWGVLYTTVRSELEDGCSI